MSDQVVDITANSFIKAYADKNWAELWPLVSSRIVYDEPATRRKTHGIKRFMNILQEWGEAFPDSKITIESTTSYGNTLVFELKWTGTHEGIIDTPGGWILPTGKKLDIPVNMVIELGERESGLRVLGEREPLERMEGPPKVESVTHYFDMATMEKQIELSPEEMVA